MVQQASHDVYIGGYLTASAQEQMVDAFSVGYSSQRENLLWHSWILAESARRAWLMGSGIQVVFLTLQAERRCLLSGWHDGYNAPGYLGSPVSGLLGETLFRSTRGIDADG